jgi:hypothetical protein
MKIALITGGQPRFTSDFIKVFHKPCDFRTLRAFLNDFEAGFNKEKAS